MTLAMPPPPPGLAGPAGLDAEDNRRKQKPHAAARSRLSLQASPFVPRTFASYFTGADNPAPARHSKQPSHSEWVNAIQLALSKDLKVEQLSQAIRIMDVAIATTQAAEARGQSHRDEVEVSRLQCSLLMGLQKLAASAAPLAEAAATEVSDAEAAQEEVPAVQAEPARQQQPDAAAAREEAPAQAFTLSSCLQVLADEDPEKLLIVRRINKLGCKAVRALRRHFSAHGEVVRVLVAHSVSRKKGDKDAAQQLRRRPSSIGFVQMASAEAVQKALVAGPEQEINGALICVQNFERQHVSCQGDASSIDVDSEDAWRERSTSSDGTSGVFEASLSSSSTSISSMVPVAESEAIGAIHAKCNTPALHEGQADKN